MLPSYFYVLFIVTSTKGFHITEFHSETSSWSKVFIHSSIMLLEDIPINSEIFCQVEQSVKLIKSDSNFAASSVKHLHKASPICDNQ